MSSTFSHKDDLIDRVFAEPFRDVGFYLDSGWPGDNYEVTVGMAMALISRGWEYGRNLLHLCFPMADHSEGLCVSDEGPGFDPAEVPDPRHPEQVQSPCGRGLFIIRNLAQSVEFNEKGNTIWMTLPRR